jgi:trk/ktr system potassium uptake protein
MVPVVYVFAYFVAAIAACLLMPAVFAIGFGEQAIGFDFLVCALLWVFVAGAMMLALRGRERRLRIAQRYLLALMLWLLLPVVAGMPLLLTVEGLSPLNAYFEAVSGLTTTGASVLPSPEDLPRSVVLWLAMTQWIGGALTLLVMVLALAPSGVGGLPEAHSRLIEHGGLPERRRLVLVVRDVFPVYLGATAIVFVLLAATDLEAFEALCLAFSAVSTGGFTPRSAELTEYVSNAGILVLTAAMLYGGTNFLWHRDIIRLRMPRLRLHRESPWAIGISLGLGLIAGFAYYRAAGQGALEALRDGIFTATSLLTTTGFEIRHASFEIFPVALVVIILAIGATSFSTGGGIKLFRVGAMLVQAGRELHRLVYPHAVRPSHLGGQSYDIQVMKAIWSGFLAFVFATLAVSLVLASQEIAYEGAVLAALSAVSNAGPVYASDWAGVAWTSYAEMDPTARLALCFGMILGRLEVIAVLGLLVYSVRRG